MNSLKILIYTIPYFLNLNLLLAQNTIPSNSNDLEVICKAWGLIKYYHPDVQTGSYDLDNLLLRSFEDIDNGKNVNEVINTWLNSMSSSDFDNIVKNESAANDSIHKWMFKTVTLDRALVDKLNYLTKTITDKKYYVKSTKIGNVEIVNEKKYSLNKVENRHIRLLILFKYWNVIEYFYPYKELMNNDWHSVLKKYIPIFISASSQLEFQLAFLRLTVELNDSHGNFFTQDIIRFYGEKYIPSYFKVIDDKVVISGHYNHKIAIENNLHPGDVIFEINGIDIAKRMNYLEEYTPGSNSARRKYNYRYSLLNGNEDSVKLGIVRDQDTIQQNVGRIYTKDFDLPLDKPKWETMDDNILYVRTWAINGKDINALKEEMMKSKGIIIDLRTYPKFHVQNRLIGIIKENKSVFFKTRIPNLKQPGKFIALEGDPSGPIGKYQYRDNIVVLVGDQTLSHAEFFVMDLQSCNNVTVVGSQTAGAVGYMSTFNVVDNYDTAFTGTGIYYPDNSNVQGKGNKIDHLIQVSIDGLKRNEDEILNAAITILKGKIP